MIFVTVGSSANGFDRVVKYVDELKNEGKIRGKVIAQIGNGSYKPEKIDEFFKFKEWDEIERLNEKADMIISHAGAGTILTALDHSKPLICVPRLQKLGEHTDSHQVEMAKFLAKEKKILVANDKTELLECIRKVSRGWKPKLEKGESKAAEEISKFIKSQM